MIKKALILIIFLYFLVLLETSFFVHFGFFKWIPNTVFLFLIIFNILESPKKNLGLYLAAAGGLLTDIFSVGFIGFNALVFLTAALLLKFILRRYVRIPLFEKP